MGERKICVGTLGNHPVVAFAVQELMRCIKTMDPDLTVEVLQRENVDSAVMPVLWVGMDPSFLPLLPAVEDTVLDDAILIRVENGSGCITGSNERSVLIGVYRFLKELGCDWVRPGAEGERIPRRKLEGDCIAVREKAANRHRGVCIEGATSCENLMDMVDFLPKIGMNAYFLQFEEPTIFFRRWYNHKSNPYLAAESVNDENMIPMREAVEREIAKRGLFYHKTGHGWNHEPFGIHAVGWSPVEEEALPPQVRGYLAQIDGRRALWKKIPVCTNLCYSQWAVRSRMVEAVVRHCRENPQIDVLHFWLADGTNNHCECDICRKKRPSDWYVRLLNELDARLTEENLPVKVAFLIYVDLLWAPETETLNNPDRFLLMFAPITRNFGQNYRDHMAYTEALPEYRCNRLDFASSLALNLAQLRQWQAHFAGDSFIYDYHLMYAHLNDPGYEKCARNVFEDMKCLPDLRLNGMVSCQLQRCFFPTALPMNMMAAALWSKDCDFDRAADRYYLSAYGPDGQLVRQYMQKISRLFDIYEGPSHGRGAKIDGVLCHDYDGLRQWIEDFAPVIARHCEEKTVWSCEWALLQIHGQYVQNLAEALRLTQQQNGAAARTAVEKLLDHINQHELVAQKVVDGNKIAMHWRRRLDPEKCRRVDVL